MSGNDIAAFFVGIGAAKSGTSWLAKYLDGHPNIAFSSIKELHYFDVMFLENPSGGWKYFDALVDCRHKAFGEITPAYSLLPESGFQAIIDLYPNAKFVFVMRDPVDRYLSQIQFSQTILEIEGRSRVDGVDPDLEAAKQLANTAYIARGDYQRIIENLLRVTDSSNLCTLFYENIFDSEKSTSELGKLCNFLEIPYLPGNLNLKVNQSGEMTFSASTIGKVRVQLSSTYENIIKNFGKDVPRRWLR